MPRTFILVFSAALSASVSFSIAIPASADDRLTVLAELPIAGTPGDL